MTIALQKGGRVERGALVLVGPGLEMSQSVDGVPILKIAEDWEGTTVAPGAGGTGLSQVGSAGTVLVSNGAELYYARVADANVAEGAAIAWTKLDKTGAAPGDVGAAAAAHTHALDGAALTGVLPPARGGTGLAAAGAAGTVLRSDGTALSYGKISDAQVAAGAAIAASKIDFTGAVLDAATLGGHPASDFVLPAELAAGAYTLPLWSVDPGTSNAVLMASASSEMGAIPNGGAGTVLLGGTPGGGFAGMSFGKVGTAHVEAISAAKIDFTGAALDAATLQGHAAAELFAYTDGALAQLAAPGDGTLVHGSNVFGPMENVSGITVGVLEAAVVVAESHMDPGAEGVRFGSLLDARAPLSSIPDTATLCVNLDADRLDGQHGAWYTAYTDALREDVESGSVSLPFGAIDAGASGLAPGALVARHSAGDSLTGIAPGAAATVLLGTGGVPAFGQVTNAAVAAGAGIAASKVDFTNADLSTYAITLGGAHFDGNGAVLDGALHVGTLRIGGLSGIDAPFEISGTTAMVANLNAELLGGHAGSYYVSRANHTGTNDADLLQGMTADQVVALNSYIENVQVNTGATGSLVVNNGSQALDQIPRGGGGTFLAGAVGGYPVYRPVAWDDVTARATTRDGYGITDVPTYAELALSGSVSIDPGNLTYPGLLGTWGVLTGFGSHDPIWVQGGGSGTVLLGGSVGPSFGAVGDAHVAANAGIAWSKIAHPTTRDGYGLTDVPTFGALATAGGAPVNVGNLSLDGVLAPYGVLMYSLYEGGAAWLAAPYFYTGGVFMAGDQGPYFGEIMDSNVSAMAAIDWGKISKEGAVLGDLGGTLAVTAGGAGVTTAALGDLVYGSGTNTRAVLTGNKTSTRKFLGQTGNGTASAAPVWVQPAFSDVTGTLAYAQLPSGGGTWSLGGGTVAVSGSLQPSGVLGIGGAAASAAMLVRAAGSTGGATAQYGVSADPAGDATATSSVTGGLFRARTQAAAFTTAALYGVDVAAPLLGAGSSATVAVGLRIADQAGAATNYSMQVGTAPSAFAGSVLVGALAVPDAAAAVEVRSTAKGFLPPRMTATQRDAIATPPDGLIVYNTTAGKLNLREAGAWKTLTSA